MDSDTKFALLVIGLPFAGLVYCGLIVALMIFSPIVRDYSLAFGFLFVLIPFITAASIWLRASAKAYKK